jgi:GR25 family glycosyltransferase involved in LPS biosynthesis
MNITEYFDKIYYINLDEDSIKKEYFEKEIQKSTISTHCERYAAVIGKYLDIRLIPDNIITKQAKNDILLRKQKIYGISLTYGSLACALSHYFIYNDCAESSKPYLIFEDDIILDSNFDHYLYNIILSIKDKDYDILYLGYNEIPGFHKDNISEFLAKPSGLITGMYAYIVSPQGAKKLLNTIFPLNKQIDSSISDNGNSFNKLCSAKKIANVRVDFGSKTQQADSCINANNFDTQKIKKVDEWNKLFL